MTEHRCLVCGEELLVGRQCVVKHRGRVIHKSCKKRVYGRN